MKHIASCLLALSLSAPLQAQDREGNDTPGEWVVDHAKSFGLWDSFCDHRTSGDATEARCYIRYVDVFSRAPNFAAQFVFITPGPVVEFGMEPGTLFAENGFRIETGGAVTWADPKPGCLVGLLCRFEGAEAEALLAAMAEGDTFTFDFTDRHGAPQSIAWDLTPFEAARADYNAEVARRGL